MCSLIMWVHTVIIFVMLMGICYSSKKRAMHCRDPEIGGSAPSEKFSTRKFLVLSGIGGGLGNYILFYPVAFYFAALTGRVLLIQDESVIAEMCRVIQCGFPLYSEMAATFPSVLNKPAKNIKNIRVGDMQSILKGEYVGDDTLLKVDGFTFSSGWYLKYNHTQDCITQLTGCDREDVSCHDRYALQRLVRGPFKSQFRQFEEDRVVGVPPNLKHGLMTLPHSYAPRLDACIHLRCQFKHFELLVSDKKWKDAVHEVDTWLNSTDFNAGMGMFRALEAKIMSELHLILSERADRERRRRLLVQQYNYVVTRLNSRRLLEEVQHNVSSRLNATELDYESEHTPFKGDAEDRIYVYLASDNERVKEALTNYLLGHTHISVMRVKNKGGHIVHAKNLHHLRENENNTGVMNLVLDWYSMSLSNILFVWRRDTENLSTFAQSASRVSGNAEQLDAKLHMDDDVNGTEATAEAAVAPLPRARGYQLVFRDNRTKWREF